jgi:hypothetical protein
MKKSKKCKACKDCETFGDNISVWINNHVAEMYVKGMVKHLKEYHCECDEELIRKEREDER